MLARETHFTEKNWTQSTQTPRAKEEFVELFTWEVSVVQKYDQEAASTKRMLGLNVNFYNRKNYSLNDWMFIS